MRRRSLLLVPMMLLVVVAASSSSSDDATGTDTEVPSCAAKLVPCGAFLNSTSTPPATCCGPLKDAAFNETKCVCAMLLDKAALQAFGVAPDQGMALAKRCGVTADASVCAKYSADDGAAGSSTTSTGNPASTVSKPTANNGSSTTLGLSSVMLFLTGFSFMYWWTVVMA